MVKAQAAGKQRTSPAHSDEGIELEEAVVCFGAEDATMKPIKQHATKPARPHHAHHSSKARAGKTRIVFKCTWPGCARQYDLCSDIERHVRSVHLG